MSYYQRDIEKDLEKATEAIADAEYTLTQVAKGWEEELEEANTKVDELEMRLAEKGDDIFDLECTIKDLQEKLALTLAHIR